MGGGYCSQHSWARIQGTETNGTLYLHRAAGCIDGTGELHQHAVARCFDDPTSIRRDCGNYQRFPEDLELGERPFLVLPMRRL